MSGDCYVLFQINICTYNTILMIIANATALFILFTVVSLHRIIYFSRHAYTSFHVYVHIAHAFSVLKYKITIIIMRLNTPHRFDDDDGESFSNAIYARSTQKNENNKNNNANAGIYNVTTHNVH